MKLLGGATYPTPFLVTLFLCASLGMPHGRLFTRWRSNYISVRRWYSVCDMLTRYESVVCDSSQMYKCASWRLKLLKTRLFHQQFIPANPKPNTIADLLWKRINTLTLCEGNPAVTAGFPTQRANDADDVSILWIALWLLCDCSTFSSLWHLDVIALSSFVCPIRACIELLIAHNNEQFWLIVL